MGKNIGRYRESRPEYSHPPVLGDWERQQDRRNALWVLGIIISLFLVGWLFLNWMSSYNRFDIPFNDLTFLTLSTTHELPAMQTTSHLIRVVGIWESVDTLQMPALRRCTESQSQDHQDSDHFLPRLHSVSLLNSSPYRRSPTRSTRPHVVESRNHSSI